jgi:hypothetical protein
MAEYERAFSGATVALPMLPPPMLGKVDGTLPSNHPMPFWTADDSGGGPAAGVPSGVPELLGRYVNVARDRQYPPNVDVDDRRR